jgi:hypothetical protein
MEHKLPSIKFLRLGLLLFVVCLVSAKAKGNDVAYLSYTGTLGTPEDVVEATFQLTSPDTVDFFTWGFGGGTNVSGRAIAPGGFDPLIALFAGSEATATMYADGFGNPVADADNLLNAPWSFVGNCPPAGTVAIGTNEDCGDVFMQVALPAGMYTLLLTDANYIPFALYDNGALSEGFLDVTAGVFQTCDPVANDCITADGNYALDIVSTRADLRPTPEPGFLSLLGAIPAVLAGIQLRRRCTMPRA